MFAVMQTRNSQVANPGCWPGCHKPETLLPLLVHSIYITNSHCPWNPRVCYTPTYICHSSINSVIQHPPPIHIHKNLIYTNNFIPNDVPCIINVTSTKARLLCRSRYNLHSKDHMLTIILHNIDFEIPYTHKHINVPSHHILWLQTTFKNITDIPRHSQPFTRLHINIASLPNVLTY